MEQQLSTPRRNVVLAGILVVLTLAVFAVAFYMFDGVGLVTELVAGVEWPWIAAVPPQAPTHLQPKSGTELILPAGMTQDTALRLWQEQVDSQEMIARLAAGEVDRLIVKGVSKDGSKVNLHLQLVFNDGTTITGDMGLQKLGDSYFVAFVTSQGGGGIGKTPLPRLGQVDVALLNTIIAEQVKSKANLQEYAEGKVESVELGEPQKGPNTIAVPFTMNEDHETATGNIVLIEQRFNGDSRWFVARFIKTGSVPKTKK